MSTLEYDKKIKYALRQMMTEYVLTTYPQYAALCEGYLEFLDESETPIFHKIINMTDNVDYRKIFPELLDAYMGQYFSEFEFNSDEYEVGDADKRFFIQYGKMLSNSKGTRKAILFLTRYLNNLALKDGTVLPKIGISIFEDESWWDKSSPDYSPFTYKVDVSFPEDFVKDLIRLYHPAGFKREIAMQDTVLSNDISSEILDGFIDTADLTKTETPVCGDKYVCGGNFFTGDPLVCGMTDVVPITTTD